MTGETSAWAPQPTTDQDSARAQLEVEQQAESRRAAAWAVAGSALDRTDARTLFEMLGLSRDDIAAARERTRHAA
jgi:hypothetical protein